MKNFLFKAPFLASADAHASLASAFGLTKTFFLTSAILSLSMLFTQPLTAQIKVLSNGNVKMGSLSSSTSTAYGLEIGYPKIRIHPSGSAYSITGAPNDLYIYGECTPSVGGGGVVVGPTSVSPTAAPYECRVTLEGHNFYIGTVKNPAHLMTTSGTAIISDSRYKNNIRDMEGGLSEILQLRPVRFDYKQLNYNESTRDSLARLNQAGFIAQEVGQIIPEAVNYNIFEDFYSLSPAALIPYLVAGIQEQNETIRELTARIAYLEAQAADQSTPDATFNSVKPKGEPAETVKAEGNRLWSNVPNPFKRETRIRYALTDGVREARLCIYDLSGKQLSCHRLNDRGESEFTLRAASLQPGIYLYSLIADGNVVDTHRMVVTE